MRPSPALFFALLLCGPAFAGSEQGPLVVVLDPGHGGRFPHDGAHGRRGLVEKNIALAVARKTRDRLEKSGVTVVLTREDDTDVSLAERARIANEAGADLFLSIHCNSMETSDDRKITRGVETYFLSPDPTDAEAKMLAELENGGSGGDVPQPSASDPVSGILADLALGQARNDSAALAQLVQRNMLRTTRATPRGVRQAPLLVLWGAKMPAALVEVGFISHPREGRLLSRDRYQTKIAEALTDAVREFADKVLARRLFAQVKDAAAPAAAPAPPVAATSIAPAARPSAEPVAQPALTR